MSELLEMVREAADNAAKRLDDMYRVSVLRIQRGALKKLLDSQYRELGTAVYGMCRRNEEDAEQISIMTVQIDGTRRRIAALDKRIDDVLGMVRCPDCGSSVKMKTMYCPVCGKRLAATEEEIYENENEMNIPQED